MALIILIFLFLFFVSIIVFSVWFSLLWENIFRKGWLNYILIPSIAVIVSLLITVGIAYAFTAYCRLADLAEGCAYGVIFLEAIYVWITAPVVFLFSLIGVWSKQGPKK